MQGLSTRDCGQEHGSTALTPKDPPQITAHICASERAAFEAYARTFGLDPASLLALLLSRELRFARLGSLQENDMPSGEPRNMKVTVHGRDLGLRLGVMALAAACGTSISNVCAVVMRAELRDRWLERALATRFESL
jgi:hypothetical protein